MDSAGTRSCGQRMVLLGQGMLSSVVMSPCVPGMQKSSKLVACDTVPDRGMHKVDVR